MRLADFRGVWLDVEGINGRHSVSLTITARLSDDDKQAIQKEIESTGATVDFVGSDARPGFNFTGTKEQIAELKRRIEQARIS